MIDKQGSKYGQLLRKMNYVSQKRMRIISARKIGFKEKGPSH